MKMVKKILLGLTATAAVIGFASCGFSDDPENAITGSGNNYSIDYENTDTENYRAYESTDMNHAGAVVKVTFDKTDVGTSKMGVIFNLTEKDDVKDFFIIGVGTAATNNFYVSRFSNVTDIQAENFGTKLKENKAVEKEIIAIGNYLNVANFKNGDSAVYYVVFQANINGSYDFGVFDEFDEKFDFSKNTVTWTDAVVHGNTLAKGGSAFTPVNDAKKIPQNKLAVYAMVAPNKTLKGSWKYLDMYMEAEEIAE